MCSCINFNLNKAFFMKPFIPILYQKYAEYSIEYIILTLLFLCPCINRVCEGVTHLKQLRHLCLNDCELDNIPPLIGRY